MILGRPFYVFYILVLLHLPPAGEGCGHRPHAHRIVKRIVNGQTAHAHSWPWMVSLLLDSRHKCGATLVHPQFVVTAAHCMMISRNLTRWTVRLGEHNRLLREGTEQDFQIAKEFIHPLYNKVPHDMDLALLKLSQPVTTNAEVDTVCLPKQNAPMNLSSECYLTGWGFLTDGSGNKSTILKEALMPIVPNKECAPVAQYYNVTDNMMCSGFGPNGTVSGCHGDSGGPFVCKDPQTKHWVLQGTVTGGTGPCGAAYTIYARINKAISLINSVIYMETC